MSDTLPDVDLGGEEYQDLYTETGTALEIQNKTSNHVLIQISAT